MRHEAINLFTNGVGDGNYHTREHWVFCYAFNFRYVVNEWEELRIPWFKNFRKRQKIGKSDLSFSEYFKEMQELQDEQANCISVHSVYSPALISQTVQGSCAKFYGLARRSQKDQILSCFFWAVNGFLNGRQDFNHHLAKVHTHFAGELNKQGLVSNFQNCLMLYAMRYVLKFNLELGLHSQKIFFMEDIVKDPNSLAIELKLIDEKHPPLTIHKKFPTRKSRKV